MKTRLCDPASWLLLMAGQLKSWWNCTKQAKNARPCNETVFGVSCERAASAFGHFKGSLFSARVRQTVGIWYLTIFTWTYTNSIKVAKCKLQNIRGSTPSEWKPCCNKSHPPGSRVASVEDPPLNLVPTLARLHRVSEIRSSSSLWSSSSASLVTNSHAISDR